MNDSSSSSTAVIALVAIAVVVALAGGLSGGRQEVQQTESHDFGAQDHPRGEAVVTTKMERGGLSAFGVTFSQPNHFVRVAFTLPPSCEVADAEQWPIANPNCTGPAGLSGSIAGNGRTAQGEPTVMVEVPVGADCYATIDLGMTWPSRAGGCGPPG